MENREEKQSFRYTYSAKQQEEIQNIRKKYAAPEEDKMAQLRRLDASVTQKASTVSLVVGILGALILGLGMSLVLTELGEMLGSYRDMSMIIGVIVGIVGLAVVCCAYPLYNYTLKKQREKIAPAILHLTDELLQ